MRRLLVALVAAAIGLSGLAAATAAPVPSRPASLNLVAKSCGSGYTHAVIGGAQKCLHAGQFCTKGYASQYRRYGYTCKRGSDGRYRLFRR